ncbi:hypothetical protein BGZ50_006393 [Haplosporangium sp. Z 11]|nr:hypothetical protein BGZ50_006393 [Haplosporangium sp. Z 11]
MELIQRNLVKIIECVTPSGPKGNVNVAGTKKILETWRNRKLFPANVIEKVEKPLLSRELGANAPASSETGFTKDDILKRMDEDRERHKRIREEIWIRPADEDPEAEFLQNWDEVSDIDDVDYEDMECENEKYLPGYPWILEFDRFLPSPAIFQSRQSAPSVTTSAITNSSSPTEEESAVAAKRLTSPDGTISLVKTNSNSQPPSPSAIFPATTATTSASHTAATAAAPFEHYHNGYQPPGRDHQRSQTYSHAYSQPPQNHQHSHPATSSSSSNAHSQSHSYSHSHSLSRQYGHPHAYYDPSIPTGPAADSAPSSRKTSPLRRSPPSSSHRASSSPHPRQI